MSGLQAIQLDRSFQFQVVTQVWPQSSKLPPAVWSWEQVSREASLTSCWLEEELRGRESTLLISWMDVL